MKKTNEMMDVTGATRRQLQFYDNKGLIKASRTNENHRLYNQECMDELWEIFIYKQAGFSLDDIKNLKRMSLPERQNILNKKMNELYLKQRILAGKVELIKDILNQEFPEKPTNEEVECGITYMQKAENYFKECVEKGKEKV